MMYRQYLLSEPWWAILIAGIVSLAFGVIVLALPLMTFSLLVIFFGIQAILFGVFGVIRSLYLMKTDKNWWILLIEGVLGTVFGILVFIWPLGSVILLVYLIAAWLVITGITAIAHGGSTAKNIEMIIMGILSVILGIFIYFTPPLYAIETLIQFIGFFAVFRGIALVVDAIAMTVAQRKAKKVTI